MRMSLFSGMQIKQKATEEDKEKLKQAQDDKVAQSKQLDIDSRDPCGMYDTGPSAGIISQFDFIAAAEMGQNLASQSSSRTEVPVKVDCEKSSSTDQTMGESSPSIGKGTTSIIGQGNALVDRIKKSLHIDPPIHDPSESSPILQDAENLHMMEASNFGEIIETDTKAVSCGEGSRDLLVEKDNQLVHALDYSAEEKLQILQQGYNTRMANISEKKELLKSEVSKITAGRVEGILSITGKHNQLCQLQQQQLHAIETEDYVKAESLALQCSALESELEILPDVSLNTHYIMEELLKSAIELQNREQATQEKVIKETKRLHQEVMELEKRFDTRLSEMEGKDKDKIEKCKLEVEKEESHFKQDMEKFKRQEAELERKISEKSQEHEKRKSVLETERARIQTEIKQQEELLNRLRQEEAELSTSIAQENEEIATIVGSFQSEMKELEIQRQNNQSRSNKLEENKREVRTVEEKRNQELAQYNEEKDRHKQLKLQIEETLKEEENLYNESRLESIWCVQAPPSFNPTKELAEATSNLKDHDSSIKILRKELLQGQKKVVSLKKQVSDLEGHIAELEQAKKLSVEGKQFSEAKSISEEIQSVTREGQQVQEELENLIKKNQEVVNELQEMQTENQKLKAHEEKERNFWEKQLRDRLISHFQTLYDDRDTKLVKINCAAAAILSSELQTSSLLLKHLCQKQDFSLPEAISDRIEEVLDGLCREDGEG